MSKLLDINEDSTRDLSQHFGGAVLYDTKKDEHMLITEVEGNRADTRIYYQDSKKNQQRLSTSMDYVNKNLKAISLDDGFINLNSYAIYLERTIDRRYKKCTTLTNTSLNPLGQAYITYNKKKVKRELDAYTVMKAMQSRYYSYREAIERCQSMFSVALTPSIAIIKQPVKDGPEPLHVIYNSVYVGEINPIDGSIDFADDNVRELVLEQLKEVGYEAA